MINYSKSEREHLLNEGEFVISPHKAKGVALSEVLREVDHDYESFKQSSECRRIYENVCKIKYPSHSVEEAYKKCYESEDMFEYFTVPGIQKINKEKVGGKESRKAGLISEKRLSLDVIDVLKTVDKDGRLKIAKTGDPNTSKFLENIRKSLQEEHYMHNTKQRDEFIAKRFLVEKNLAKVRPNATLIEKGVSTPETVDRFVKDAFDDILGDRELSYNFEPDNDIPLYDTECDWLVNTISVKRSASDQNFEIPIYNAYENIKYQRENHNPDYIFWPYCFDATKHQLTSIVKKFKGCELAKKFRIPTATPYPSCVLSDNIYNTDNLLLSHDEFMHHYANSVKKYLKSSHKSNKFFSFVK